MAFRVPSRAAPESLRRGAKDVKRYVGRVHEILGKKGEWVLSLVIWEVVSVRPTVLANEDPDGQYYASVLLGGPVRSKGRFTAGDPVGIFTWTDTKGTERVFVERLGVDSK